MASSHMSSVMSLARDVKSGSVKEREKAVDDLTHVLKNRTANLTDLGDKGYHDIFEAIFNFVLKEKPAYYDKRKSQASSTAAGTRLSKCATAVRMAANRGSSKLGRKTLLAVIDHITQVLPGPDDGFVLPLLQDYVKALTEVISRQHHVELLSRKDGAAWDVCVDLFLDIIVHILPSEPTTASLSLSRASPVPGSNSTPRSTGRSHSSLPGHPKRNGQGDGGPLRDALEGLNYLVLASNAPLLRRSQDITKVVLRILSMKNLSLGSMQTICFAIVNTLFSATQADNFTHANNFVKDLIPLMSFWWRSEKVSQDELIRGLRNEISKSIFLAHLHIEYLTTVTQDTNVRSDLEDLADNLWSEYSKRNESVRLQLADLTFASSGLPADYFQLSLFGLRPHNIEGESHWALVQNLATLETTLLRSKGISPGSPDAEEPARKRRRTAANPNRLRLKLASKTIGMQRTALQLIPFMLSSHSLTSDEVQELLLDLAVLAGDKNTTTASWALIACSSCVSLQKVEDAHMDTWRQIWHLAARSVSLPATCRAACLLLHSVIEAGILPYQAISQEINSIVTTADVNGPGVLCDTSLALMFHLFHVRNSRLPSAGQITCSHIIRWVFMKWSPSESAYASFHSFLVRPSDFVNLVRVCCGAQPLPANVEDAVSGGALSETWKSQKEMAPFNKYLLLLEESPQDGSMYRRSDMSTVDKPPMADPSSIYVSKKLVLELLYPKLEELEELCNLWGKKSNDGGVQISLDRFQSLLSASLIGAMLLPQVSDLNSTQSSSVESMIMNIVERSMTYALDSVEPKAFVDLSLRTVRPCIPDLTATGLGRLQGENNGLLRLLTTVSTALEQRPTGHNPGDSQDFMDVDEFDSQNSKASWVSSPTPIPRQIVQMRMNSQAFYADTKSRLCLLQQIYDNSEQIGLVPESYIDELLSMSNDDLLCCQSLLIEISRSDLVASPASALKLLERLGAVVGLQEYQCCEVALTTCIEVIDGLHNIWLQDSQDLAEGVGDLYNHFIKICLPSNVLSPKAQMSLSRLLFTLLRADPEYGTNLGLDSCRTSLLYILRQGTMKLKCFITNNIADIFELYILMLHDEIFVDVLDSLPTDPQNTSGIAFRLLVLSKLACRWPTLLRRCTYHIFETPGKISVATEYAQRCLSMISDALSLESPKDLFQLFSRQLLYTWLDGDSIDEIPFSIFGFQSLADLLRSAQAEIVGLTIMRGQDLAYREVTRQVGTSDVELLQQNFTTALAYTMVYEDAFGGPNKGQGEERIKKRLGSKFTEAVYVNFVDIVALFFDLIDQEDAVEKVFSKHPDLAYAGNNLVAIKKISSSQAKLPPNQQPTFRARYVFQELFRLSQSTEFQFHDLWTPALVASVARKLLSTVHPALGSLHACSVLRKVRILISLAGPVVLSSYCLEMLLNSIRPYIVDSECADDALGISQYLLMEGSTYLSQRPSFLAGYSLSTLASLRVFLESSQSSTTQESQFKATMSKAQRFHEWLSKYLENYNSSLFRSEEQRRSFKSITESAANIRSSGNAEKDTSESKLLSGILKDEAADDQLLNESSRQLALGLLCGDFAIPAQILDDFIESDAHARQYASAVWKSCETRNLSENYLAWAGRVVGRSFSASGEIPDGILRESRLADYAKIAPSPNGSEMGILGLLQDLVSDTRSGIAGLAEAALRTIVSEAILEEDEMLVVACQRTLSEPLFLASQWGSYRPPPSETESSAPVETDQNGWAEAITSPNWLSTLGVSLTRSVSKSILLSALSPIMTKVKGFAEKSFPFVVHLVLHFQLEQQQTLKRILSDALKGWLQSIELTAKENQKLLINTILYLRTQEYPKEASIADRLHWLDIDYTLTAACASRCGMYKTGLLFAELVSSEAIRPSRRASAINESNINETLLTIFENIDDPDAYYGLPEDASLSTVLARVEYENEGTKSLAFRGAQYDSHVRLRHPDSENDAQALVKALGMLGLAGLSHSLLQTQQNLDASPSSVENTFRTARRLEIWNLPAPTASDHHAVAVYKAYQSIHQASDASTARTSIYDGFSLMMQSLTTHSTNATAVRNRLGALAVLTELDDLLNVSNSTQMDNILAKFEGRSGWMRSGIYDDVSQILSCRGTTMSVLSQHASLLKTGTQSVANLRQMEVKSMLLASGIYRFHKATQESLTISTALTDLLERCENLDLHVDAAVKIEVANSLWDHGEMGTSIRMLQGIDRESSLKIQTIPVSRSDLLSKIGHKVSVARLEKPRDIQKKYLDPALKELRGASDGKEAGLVFHQFAMFCDEQLQDADGLEDLARLQNLRRGKSDEVNELKSLISSTRDTQLKTRYSHVLSKEKQWLDLDEQELRRVEQTRNEFVRLSLENYLLALMASDEHNNDALRFTALWLERSDEDTTNKAVSRNLSEVPTRKFATLMNQLTSRLQNQESTFQKLLFELVYSICVDHPYHGMYQIWSGTKVKVQQKDEVAVQRVKATERVAQRLAANKSVADIWLSIDKTSKYYHGLAMEKNPNKYKSGARVPLKESNAGHNLVNCLARYRIPPPTMHIEVNANKDYSDIPMISKLEPTMQIASGVSAPKIITVVASNGAKYKQLVKGGHDDLRQDAIMEQVFAAVSSLLKLHRSTQQRNLGIRTYKVLPLTASSGLIEFVPNTIPLHEFLMPAHERYYPRDLKGSQCRKEIFNVQNRTVETRISTYRKVTEKFHPVMKYFFMEYFVDPDEWFTKRLAYTRSTAAISMLGHILGLGDRHGHNILLDSKTGEVVHIDLGVAFEAGRILPVPELVPFRLTRDTVDGMGITKTEGVFRRCCEVTLDALREEQYSIMTILDVLRYDPLYTWSISPLRLAKLQKARSADDGATDDPEQSEAETKKGKKQGGHVNEPSEADRALEVVRKKLSKALSVTATVNDLINQATDERNLAVLYSGWAAYA